MSSSSVNPDSSARKLGLRAVALSHLAVTRSIQQSLEDGEMSVGQMLPAERVLSMKYGVSRSVIRQSLQELEELGLIRQAPNCRPVIVRLGPKAPVVEKTADQIAVWISPDMEDFGAVKMLEGIRRVLGLEQLQLIIGCPSSKDTVEVRSAVNQFVQSLLDNPHLGGTILWAISDPALTPAYQRLSDAGVPVVYIDREPPESISADMVATNHRRAARNAVRHLIELGHRSIAMVANDDPASSVRDRIAGYREAMAEAGLPAGPEKIFEVSSVSQTRLRMDSESAVHRLFALQTPPTAIFTVNDTVAIYLQESIERTGRQVPRDVSLVGFDWMLRWLPSGGELTSVAQPFDEIGELAARCLLERIASTAPPIHRHTLLEAPVIVRRSTGTPMNSSLGTIPASSENR
ncbi:GntR family transcriptional regulator [bacterium]|nr:MAG: GntR family transcriptional regulator [bacterium]